jgi:hypothetical protein
MVINAGRLNVSSSDNAIAWLFSRRYIQAARKLTQFVQSIRPNEDASKNVRM